MNHEEVCAGCGLPQSAWEGEDGQGYSKDGDTYCCRECAEGIGCTCDAHARSGM